MKSLEDIFVYDLIREPETVIDIDQDTVHNLWLDGYFEYTETLYNRKSLRIAPYDIKRLGSLEAGQDEMFGNYPKEYRAYIEAGTQLLPYAECFKGKHVLDIGCGNGDLAFVMEKLGAETVTAADVHSENIDTCNKIKRHFKSKVNFEVKDVNNLTVDYLKQFDTVCAFQCLSWTNCHVEFFKNVNRAGVKDILITDQIRGLPIAECINDKSYNHKEPMLVHYFDDGYHYGGTGWQADKPCLRVYTNLPFWVQVLDYYGWYIQHWSWQKNCTFNKKQIETSTYRRRFMFHCINTTRNCNNG